MEYSKIVKVVKLVNKQEKPKHFVSFYEARLVNTPIHIVSRIVFLDLKMPERLAPATNGNVASPLNNMKTSKHSDIY